MLAGGAAAVRLRSMENTIANSQQSSSRIWYVIGGILSVFVGFYAVSVPWLATVLVVKFIAVVALASGLILFVSAVFGKARQHRWLDFLSAGLRIIVGLILVTDLLKAVLVLTLVIGWIFIVEGIFGVFLGLKLRGKNPAWGWVAISGIASLVLGVMLLNRFPEAAVWAIGLLFGINCLFTGFSLIMYGTALPRAQEA